MGDNAAGLVTTPKPDDVLLGRGAGSNDWIGNQRFRDLLDERRTEYTSYSRFEPKQKIAKEIVDKVHERGGRFLRLVESNRVMQSIVKEGVGEVATEKAALDKVKQGLREKSKARKEKAARQKAVSEANAETKPAVHTPSEVPGVPPYCFNGTGYVNGAGYGGAIAFPPSYPMNYSFVPNGMLPIPSTLPMNNAILPRFTTGGAPTMVGDQQLLPFQTTSFPTTSAGSRPPQALAQPMSSPPVGQTSTVQGAPQEPYSYGRDFAANAVLAKGHNLMRRPTCRTSSEPRQAQADRQSGGVEQGSVKALEHHQEKPSGSTGDKHDAFLALSALSVADRPRFSEEQEAHEKASLTIEERADILADMFGKRCNVTPRQNKRAKKDLDRESIDFLIKFMRSEIDSIPDEKKQALLEVHSKCENDEFSDERLESFLRCEGMNAKLAAKRFICYWEDRKEVFGEDKFTLPMTLSGALRDDLAAIEAGVYVQLPNRDTSSRQVLWMEPCRHSKDVCTPESLLRAYWYLIEVTSKENDDIGRGYVNVVWDKKSTLWDYDRHVYDSITRFEKSSWPVRVVAHHICCAPKFTAAIMKPIFFFVADKFTRTRTKFHHVPESEIVESLSRYGILGSILPTDMGGALEFDQHEWIAQRRAAEMEEIA